ncbi:MAG: hypothetical protein JWO94_2986 [Verrucomicrobiaceae bacterium]|nr:hypothetical protein [Verrucomicrobiaceae bacterium]
MKTALIAFLFSIALPILAGEVVVSVSPYPHHFEVVLTTDRDQPEYILDTVPDIVIRHRGSKFTLATLPYTSDVNSDKQTFRDHTTVNWGDNDVAITTDERYYSALSVFRFVGTYASPKRFDRVQFPNIVEIIKATIPKLKEFRSRWHEHFQGWPGDKLVMFSAGSSAITEPRADGDVAFPARFSFTFDISDPAAPVLRRMEAIE